jgi:hypothetical protein
MSIAVRPGSSSRYDDVVSEAATRLVAQMEITGGDAVARMDRYARAHDITRHQVAAAILAGRIVVDE